MAEEKEKTTRVTATNAKPSSPAAGEGAPAGFYVDGRAVPEDEYLEAAGRAGWNVTYLRQTPNYRPAINTK